MHKRVDLTIRSEVLPALAAGMGGWARTVGIDLTEDQKREEIEQAALTLVFRLVFVLYCESAGYLPLGRRPYAVKSLSSLVEEAAATKELLSTASFSLWRGFGNLVHAMRRGNPAWEVPAYNGALFSARDLRGAELLEEMEIPDPVFGRVRVALGRDPETGLGADFSTLEIAHIGHIYESLLSLRLALASRPLRYDGKKDRYVPVDENASQDDRAARQRNAAGAEVQVGELLWQTHEGGRKAGGVYYTPVDLVRHLVERSVLPAFERRLEETAALANTDATRAARELLEFAVVDPACGSAHFLVQVAETLAERTVRFLAEHNLPLIAEEIEKLRAGATARADIDDVALLRRLLVKNCVFGVDVSPMGAEVAKLSLWLATFVPGLSLAHLGRNVLVGDSLIGVADAERLQEELELPLFAQKIRQELQEATRRIRSLLEIQDRTPEEVKMSQQADREAEKAAAGVRRVFDLWTAEQFGLEQARHHVGFHGVDVLDGSGWACSELVAKAGELARRHGFLHWPLARVAFRDVSQPDDSRSVRACLVPAHILLANTAPYLAWVSGAEREQAACLGLMNSLPFDWQARRFIERHVSFFLLELLYLPEVEQNNFDAIADAAARLSAVDSRFAEFAVTTGVDCGPLDEAARQHLRIEVDAWVARSWNLTAADLDLILQDFSEAAVPPAYRAALLDRFQELP